MVVELRGADFQSLDLIGDMDESRAMRWPQPACFRLGEATIPIKL